MKKKLFGLFVKLGNIKILSKIYFKDEPLSSGIISFGVNVRGPEGGGGLPSNHLYSIFKSHVNLESSKTELMNIAKLIVPSQMKHHAEAEACDLLMEVEQLDILEQYVDEAAYNRKLETF